MSAAKAEAVTNGNLDAQGRSSDGGGSSIGSNNSSRGILTNAHEAPKRNPKAVDSGIRSALKSAFIPTTPGKQMKTNGKPLGKSFERQQPLSQSHEGGEILKVDPRGRKASVGDGIIFSPSGSSTDDEMEMVKGRFTSASDLLKVPNGNAIAHERGRSDSVSTSGFSERSESVSSNQSSSNNPCCIKFAPLPTSGRLKRANSITIGVAARSQLLQSQGGGRSGSNAAAWQQQWQQQQQNKNDSSNYSRHSGIQGRDEQIDLGQELRKGAAKAWNRVRRGSSVSSGSSASQEASKSSQPAVESVDEEAEGHDEGGEKTPKRPSSPLHMSAEDEEPEGSRTPRHGMQRRVSTGAFLGAQSFREMEEKRKRANRDEDNEDQRELNAQFAELLGRTGESRVAHHTDSQAWHPGMQTKPDGASKETDIVDTESNEGTSVGEGDSLQGDESDGREDGEDDDETKEAERLADEALNGHTAKATKAGGVEKMERKRGRFGLRK